jgi:hypothetical protein
MHIVNTSVTLQCQHNIGVVSLRVHNHKMTDLQTDHRARPHHREK